MRGGKVGGRSEEVRRRGKGGGRRRGRRRRHLGPVLHGRGVDGLVVPDHHYPGQGGDRAQRFYHLEDHIKRKRKKGKRRKGRKRRSTRRK